MSVRGDKGHMASGVPQESEWCVADGLVSTKFNGHVSLMQIPLHSSGEERCREGSSSLQHTKLEFRSREL